MSFKDKTPMPLGKYEVRLHWVSPDGTQEIHTEHHIMVTDEFYLGIETEDEELMVDTKVVQKTSTHYLDLPIRGRLMRSPDNEHRYGSITTINHGVTCHDG